MSAATLVTALVMEAMRTIVSVRIRTSASRSAQPKDSRCARRPLRATRVTIPATRPSTTYCRIVALSRPRRSCDSRTASGFAGPRASARARRAGAVSVRARVQASLRVMRALMYGPLE